MNNKIKNNGFKCFVLAKGLVLCLLQPALAKESIPLMRSVCATPNAQPIHPKIQLAVKTACDEHALWGKPMINANGHLIQIGPMEGETDKLTNDEMAWTRVLHYWTVGVGVSYLYAANDMAVDASESVKNAFIRTRIIDNPWSGAFISYVMKSAGLSEQQFALNDGHIRYIKPAFAATLAGKHNEANDYAFTAQNPLSTRMSVGDLICYAREGQDVYGVRGFNDWLMAHYNDDRSLKTHCDIVVGVVKNRAYSIGGNVAQSVTMRQLNLTSKGFLSPKHILPVTQIDESWPANALDHENETAPACEPISGVNCDMNRKDWVILLKARS